MAQSSVESAASVRPSGWSRKKARATAMYAWPRGRAGAQAHDGRELRLGVLVSAGARVLAGHHDPRRRQQLGARVDPPQAAPPDLEAPMLRRSARQLRVDQPEERGGG